MRAFISADMEGITGVAAAEDVISGTDEYDRGQTLLHSDVNAAVEGAFAGGADEVLVNDSHASMRNLERAALDDRADLLRGNTKPRSMVQGLESGHDVALFVGYHAMAGTAGAVLNHTVLGHEVVRLLVDDTEVGELGWNLRYAAALGVPLGLVTGDDATVAEARAEPGDPETVAVKAGIDRFTARCRPVEVTTTEIREATTRAVERARDAELPVPVVEDPTTVAVDWTTTNQAARAGTHPGVERVSDRRTSVTAQQYPDAYEAAVAMIRAGASGTDDYYG
jgi:D-amino peptidase